jgi:hypothetical protein
MTCRECDLLKQRLRNAEYKREELEREAARNQEEMRTLRYTISMAINILGARDEENACERERLERQRRLDSNLYR